MKIQGLLLSIFLISNSSAQEYDNRNHPSRSLQAFRLEEKIILDGRLTEKIWQRESVSEFTQRDPIEGNKPSQRTKVWVGYDDEALYVAAKLYDSAPDSIVSRLARRDESVSSDQFEFQVDPWLDHRTGFFFRVSVSGAVRDGILFNDDWDDDSWDGVWESATSIDYDGWNVELRIPFSQLRFPEKEVHTWGVNFIRKIWRSNERVEFVMIPKESAGKVSWFAHMNGINNIKQPKHVEFLPYAASRSEFIQPESGDPFNDGAELFNQIGFDVKYGLSSSLTLDATINPDFGQVEVDPAVVNLSDFETFFPEKRPFFIEGSNIFTFGSGGVKDNWSFNYGNPTSFYTRRIGRAPQGRPIQEYDYSSVPSGSTILGAGKISGKLTPEWSIGVVNALTAREYADLDRNGLRFREEVEPVTNYTVLRTQREFKEGRHGLGVIGTGVKRNLPAGNLEETLTNSAFMGGVDGWVTLDNDKMYVVNGWIGTSRINGSENVITNIQSSSPHYFQRPDVDHIRVDSTAISMTGMAGRLYLNKQKGNVILNSGFAMVSPGYEVNDLGFQWNADQINWHLTTGWKTSDPGKFFRSQFHAIATFRNWDYEGNKYGEGYFLFANFEFLNYWDLSFDLVYNPETLNKSHTRGGPFTKQPSQRFRSILLGTDGRKSLSYSIGFQYGTATRQYLSYNTGVTWKPNSTFKIDISPRYSWDTTEAFYVGEQEDPLATATYGIRYLFAETDNRSASIGTRINWTFSPKLSLQFYMQPLIFAIKYVDYKELAEPGEFKFNIYGQDNGSTVSQSDDGSVFTIDPDGEGAAEAFDIDNRDFNFKSFRGNAVLRWEYNPGSVFYLAWTQNRSDFESGNGLFDFGNDTNALFNTEPDNIVLAKISYWWNP